MMKPLLEHIPKLFSDAADLDEISGNQDDFLDLLKPDREEELSDEELALAAGGLSPAQAKRTSTHTPMRPDGLGIL